MFSSKILGVWNLQFSKKCTYLWDEQIPPVYPRFDLWSNIIHDTTFLYERCRNFAGDVFPGDWCPRLVGDALMRTVKRTNHETWCNIFMVSLEFKTSYILVDRDPRWLTWREIDLISLWVFMVFLWYWDFCKIRCLDCLWLLLVVHHCTCHKDNIVSYLSSF